MPLHAPNMAIIPEGEGYEVVLHAVADCGDGGKSAKLVRNALLGATDKNPQHRHASALLVAGDIGYEHGTLKEYTHNFFDVWAPVLRHVPIITVLGRHAYFDIVAFRIITLP